ncbi:cytidylyltransferase domain-containing protein [Flavobacterium sp. CLA17]|uniref:acylneuraminate cytidylyltransferase family protein n=1 Tax=Flavobacterium sp. CLA17 TaxID=2724135 RepID=UPI00149201DB|nr:acylneuraminate cytidylyltransferase family protein [Flavobacterium sp. CLA17]QSB27955.1 acylneuraminate cytidylyltransferase family protein [Flavobacterium sp. CLA17]
MEAGQLVKSKVIAVIPARGGSKRIPNKNIIDFFGKPMIAWTIEAALKSGIFDVVLVSTDNKEIAEIAIEYGAQVPFLRQEASDDFSPVALATIGAIKQMEYYKEEQYDIVVQLMANCPLRSSVSIIKAYEEFLKDSSKTILSSFHYGMFNPWWAHRIDENNNAKPLFDDDLRNKRSQDQSKLFCPTGAIWISKVNDLKNYNTFYSDNYRFYPISWLEAVDIDDYDDFQLAKAAFNILNESN